MTYTECKEFLEEHKESYFVVEKLHVVRDIEDIEKEAIFEKRIGEPFSLEVKERLTEYIVRFWIKADLVENSLFDITWQAIFEGAWELESYIEFKERMWELV